DLKFVDVPGQWQHFSIPVSEIDADSLIRGFGFDGSSIRGFQEIHESDMLLIPALERAFVDPFCPDAVSLICNVKDPESREFYARDPRNISLKAENFLKESGIADTSCWGPEAEFFVFDSIRFEYKENSSFHRIDSAEGHWNSGNEIDGKNLGYKIRSKEGYFPVSPHDTLQSLRSDIVGVLEGFGIRVEAQHHEVATAGQCEIDMRFDSLTKTADNLMLYKYAVKNVSLKHGKSATFMPKPLFNDNGSGMHVHQSLWKNGKNIFYNPEGYAGLSETALYYIGGLLKHAPALCAIIAPTTNSYKRLVPGFEAPVNLVYSKRNRSAACRIPMYFNTEKSKRVEFRTPDPSCNPYLAFSAMLLAGLDGIKHKIHPGDPSDTNIYDLTGEAAKKIKSVPGSLHESLEALEADNEFLLQGKVFTKDLIEKWLELKSTKEVEAVRLRPHPYEYHLYYDA
ncbi:MAG: type I glutamate--ammonia ligase, partial [Candidatus Diapherotrites archaeon]|nr:type I glutamate--ammonia ligase [Candidatus Diapherotrites archaeon]